MILKARGPGKFCSKRSSGIKVFEKCPSSPKRLLGSHCLLGRVLCVKAHYLSLHCVPCTRLRCHSKAALVISFLESGGGACCGRRWAPGRQGQAGAPATCVTHRGSSSGSLCMKAPCMSLHCVTWSGVTLRDGTLRRNGANRSSLGQKRKIVLNDDARAKRGASHPLLCKEHKGPNVFFKI